MGNFNSYKYRKKQRKICPPPIYHGFLIFILFPSLDFGIPVVLKARQYTFDRQKILIENIYLAFKQVRVLIQPYRNTPTVWIPVAAAAIALIVNPDSVDYLLII
jgi:hypothetical protein